MVLLSALSLAAGATAGLHFPRDHYGHDVAIEWWYVTADVHGSDGDRYSVFFTVFKRGTALLPVSQVIDLDTGARIGHTQQVAAARIGPAALNVRLPTVGLSYSAASNTWRFHAADLTYSLKMTATPQKPYVLHGGGSGVIQQGGATSRYYSETRMAATGTIRHDLSIVSFTGKAWLDHQWGNFPNDPSALHWDWFSCRFDDRTELMLYRFRDGHESGTAVDRSGHGRTVTSFTARSGSARLPGRRPELAARLGALRAEREHLTVKLHATWPTSSSAACSSRPSGKAP